MTLIALTTRFIVELVAFGAVGYWGLQTAPDGIARIVLAIGAPLALIVLWARFIAPKAPSPLTQPQRDLVGTGIMLVAACALAAAGQPSLGLAFAVVVVVDWLIIVALGPESVDRLRATAARGR
jgi:hypothetical protein